MNSLTAFGVMAAAGVLAAFIYDIFRASRRAARRVLIGLKEFRRLRAVFLPIQDVLSALAAFLLFLLASYICVSGAIRGYVLAGFLCGIVFYAGLLTRFTGKVIYFVFCLLLRIPELLLIRIPRRITGSSIPPCTISRPDGQTRNGYASADTSYNSRRS